MLDRELDEPFCLIRQSSGIFFNLLIADQMGANPIIAIRVSYCFQSISTLDRPVDSSIAG